MPPSNLVERRAALAGILSLTLPAIAGAASTLPRVTGRRLDARAIAAALDRASPGSRITIPQGVYVAHEPLRPRSGVTLDLNRSVIIAADDATFEYLVVCEKLHNFRIENGTLDVNGAGRARATPMRKCGLLFDGCEDCEAHGVTISDTMGHQDLHAVCAATIGGSQRCGFRKCLATEAGTLPLASDGFFISGDNCYAIDCDAHRCTDTGFVLESGNFGLIEDCRAVDCSAGGAITNASALVSRGNRIRRLVITNWHATVTGGISVGVPTKQTGDLVDSEIDTIMKIGPNGKGLGPAIAVRTLGGGRTRGLKLTGIIEGASAQGVLVDGTDVTVAMDIRNAGASCVQFEDGSSGIVMNARLRGGTFGVSALGDAQVEVRDSDIAGQRNHNVYGFARSHIALRRTSLGVAGIGHVGNQPRARISRE